jgi:hypothetical protein
LSSKTVTKDSLREIYHESKQRIRIVLNLLGKPEPNKQNPLPDEKSFTTISTLINSIMSASQFEPKNQYGDAIYELSNWMNFAFNKKYLTENMDKYPNPLYLFKKGAEILHSFLHRDLRRKQFSSEEDEIYRNFMSTINSLPNPRPKKLNQDEVEGLLNDLLKTS